MGKTHALLDPYGKLEPPLYVLAIGDAAFRADEPDCLAVRAAIIVLAGSDTGNSGSIGGRFHLVEQSCMIYMNWCSCGMKQCFNVVIILHTLVYICWSRWRIGRSP